MGTRKAARPSAQQFDEVTEAGIESFPASDPPAYNLPGRARQHERERERVNGPRLRSRAAPRETAQKGASGGRAQGSAIRQGMARQNVRIGAGHDPTAAETGSRTYHPGRAALIVVGLLLAALAVWIALA